MGKGRGKGGDGEGAVYALAFILAVFVAGCYLVGAGGAKMWKTNNRETTIASYQAAAKLFRDSDTKYAWGNTTAMELMPLGLPLTRNDTSIIVRGSLDGVPSLSHVSWNVGPVPFNLAAARLNGTGNYTITDWSIRYSLDGYRQTAPLPRMLPVTPTPMPQEFRCGSKRCTVSTDRDKCTDSPYWGTWDARTGESSVKRGQVSGICTYWQYQRDICLVLNLTSYRSPLSRRIVRRWVEADNSTQRCQYPQSSNVTQGPDSNAGTSESTFKVQLLPVGDPYLALQRITQGTSDFGASYLKQKATGVGMFVGGWCLVCLICGPIIKVTCDPCKKFGCCTGGSRRHDSSSSSKSTHKKYAPRTNVQVEDELVDRLKEEECVETPYKGEYDAAPEADAVRAAAINLDSPNGGGVSQATFEARAADDVTPAPQS